MKKLLLSIMFLLSAVSFANEKIPITITKIIDGDTVNVQMQSGNKFALRMVGIDCFEAYENHRTLLQANENNLPIKEVLNKGKESKKYLEKLKNSATTISFEFRGLDKYSRVLGILYFDNTNINQKLIDENYCRVFEYKENN